MTPRGGRVTTTECGWLPHSCGNRHCPQCQAHESQCWIDKQLQKRVPGEYFMITFTLPTQFRQLSLWHQRVLYELIIRNAWATVNTFSQNDKRLRGTAGAVTVLAFDAGAATADTSVQPATIAPRTRQAW